MRRILWNIYAWAITFLLVAAYIDSIHQIQALKLLDVVLSIPSLLALHLHIWDKKVGSSTFWKAYVPFFIVWEFAFNIVLDPMSRAEKLNPEVMVVGILLLPLYVANVRYAFRKWTGNETHNQEEAPA